MTTEVMFATEDRLSLTGLAGYVRNWLNAYRKDLGLHLLKMELQDVPSKKLTAWYETPRYVVDINAWEQAYCLGIMVIDKQSDSIIYTLGGVCESDDEVYGRLDAFARWLSAHQDRPISTAALDYPLEASAA